MFLKRSLIAAILFMGIIFAVFIFIDLSSDVALAQEGEIPNQCGNNDAFTQDFLIDNCQFKARGYNTYFILLPGFQFVLETPDDPEDLEDIKDREGLEEIEVRERALVTVLREKKEINLNGRKIHTRVVEERALEWEAGEEGEADEWKTIEISLNWVAICTKTNDVYYFGEWSRDCEDGFDENDVCPDNGETNEGSWEAGVDGAKPGILMPGTFLLGAKYFQEIAPPAAVDRGQHVAMGVDVNLDVGEWDNCVQVADTNPAEGQCDVTGEDADIKTYCPGIGLVQDQDLELVDYGFVSRKGRLLGKKLKTIF